MRRLAQLSIFLICLVWTPLFAQSKEEVDFKKAVDAIQVEKRDLVRETMKLTEKEREGFWPLYDEYQEVLQKIGGRMLRLIKSYAEEYKSMSDQ